MVRNPGSSDGSAPAVGGFEAGSGGTGATRRRPPSDEMAQVATDGTRSPEMAQRNAEAVEAQGLVNSGAAALDGAGPVNDPGGLLSGGGGSGSRTTSWADPSSLSG